MGRERLSIRPVTLAPSVSQRGVRGARNSPAPRSQLGGALGTRHFVRGGKQQQTHPPEGSRTVHKDWLDRTAGISAGRTYCIVQYGKMRRTTAERQDVQSNAKDCSQSARH
eukprot:gene25027-biopygen4459